MVQKACFIGRVHELYGQPSYVTGIKCNQGFHVIPKI